MTVLQDLPLDILDTILSYPHKTHQLLRLWKCGDKRMQANLANGVTVVRLVDTMPISNSQFPMILTYLRSLRSLYITRGVNSLGDAITIRNRVKRLPKSLQEIEFQFKEAQLMFMASHAVPDWMFNEDETRNDVSNDFSSESSVLDISSIFPNLKSLKLHGDAHFTANEVSCLPSTLTCLGVSWKNGIVDCSAYPRGLLQCMVQGKVPEFLSPENLRLLPPNLTELRFFRPFNIKLEQVAALPCSLTELPNISLVWSHEIATALPPHMVNLKLSDIAPGLGNSMFQWLPSQLRELSLVQVKAVTIEKIHIQSLPRTLRRLDLAKISWNDLKYGDFPPLHRLWCSSQHNEALTEERISALPSSLFSLQYTGKPSSVHILNGLAKQAPSLETICVGLIPIAEEKTPLLAFSLPVRTRFLNITGDFGDGLVNDRLVFQPFSTLPAMLRILTLDHSSSRLAVSQLIHLPRALRSLSVNRLMNDWEGWRPKVDNGYVLPPTAYQEIDIFRNLPPELVTLVVERALYICDPMSFSGLPKTLDQLTWQTSEPLSRKLLKYLPQGLNDCKVYLDVLTNEDLSILPRSLRWYGITAADTSAVTLEAIHLLPPNIYAWGLDLRNDIKLPQKFLRYQQTYTKQGHIQ